MKQSCRLCEVSDILWVMQLREEGYGEEGITEN